VAVAGHSVRDDGVMRADGDVIVRAAEPSDASAVTDLVQDAYGHYVARIGRPPAPMSVDYARAIADGMVWVVEVDDQVVGVIVLHDAPDHVLIDNVAVRPTLQGRGIGSRLLDFAERHARVRRVSELRLYTNDRMTENLEYYPRRGYTEVDRRIEAGFRRVFFKKTLP
jgi:N-acetylglutamate synthase-like GNAT family acetyltransferase